MVASKQVTLQIFQGFVPGTWREWTASTTILPGHPLIGQPLSIILVDGDSQDSSEPHFDNVRLDNVQLSSVSEPGTWLLVAGW